MSAHVCHAHGCGKSVPSRRLFCLPHWRMVRPALQLAVWREYRPGQETDKRPSLRYLAVQRQAVGEVAFKPHDEAAARTAAPYLLQAQMWRRKAIDAGLGDPLDGLTTVPPFSADDAAAVESATS